MKFNVFAVFLYRWPKIVWMRNYISEKAHYAIWPMTFKKNAKYFLN